MTDKRLTAMEEQMAHLTRLADDLSDAVARHQTEIARLTRIVAQLSDREAQRQADAGDSAPLADQPPPHW